MKILQVINTLGMGGAEKLLVDSVSILKKRGYDVDILLLKKILILDVPIGVNVYSLSNRSVYNPMLILKIPKYINKYDIVHVHLFPSQYFVAIAKYFSSKKIKLVTTEHSTDNRRRNIWYFKHIDQYIYKKYEKIICISDKANKNLANYLDHNQNLITINNGINLQVYDTAKPYKKTELLHISDDIILITQVAGFRQEKDQDTIIKAIAKLPKKYHAVFVGDGERRVFCENLALACGVKEQVHFLGIRKDISRILKTSDIVVMSSHYEGLSLSSIEGMCCGKPFVASDVPGLHEVVNGAGLLFEHENAEQLAQIIKKLSEDKTLYSETVEKCKQRALLYDIEKMVDGYEKVYKELCQI